MHLMRTAAHLSLALGMLLTVATARPAVAAETVEQYLNRICPNRVDIADAKRAAQEADAMDDSDKDTAHRAIARQYFRCSQNATDARGRDYATLGYAAEMLAAFGRRQYASHAEIRDAMPEMERMAKVTNDVAARTSFRLVRQRALMMRDQARDILAHLRAELKKASGE